MLIIKKKFHIFMSKKSVKKAIDLKVSLSSILRIYRALLGKAVFVMRMKYFTAGDLDSTVLLATRYFGCDKEELVIEETETGDNSESCLFIAITGTPEKVANMSANYGLFYENEGIYLELYKERGIGKDLEVQDLMQHLSRKNIKDLDVSAVQDLVKKAAGRIKIARSQDEYIYGEELRVVISGDNLQASVTLLAPEAGGEKLSLENAKKKLSEAGVVYGLNEQELTDLLERKNYNKVYVVAKATLPQDGEDGKLLFNFSTDKRTGSPMEIGGSRVDYRSLDLYVPVEKGQLLVTVMPSTEGIPGKSVSGETLYQKQGKTVSLPRGINVETNGDMTEMYAACSGMVEYVNNSVNVSNVYKVKGDCDLSVGNIDFDGSVYISGSVRSGSTIKATGCVIVDGSVEAATIIAGGNVEIKGGMQGADRGLIDAGGAVKVMYVERATIMADGPVTFDTCIHSTIETGDTLTAAGRRGAIMGGRVNSSGNIVANFIGAISNTRTEVAVGVMPRKQARLRYLDSEISKADTDKHKLDQLDAYLKRSKNTMDPKMWEHLYTSSVENRRLQSENLSNLQKEKESIIYEIEHATAGMIHVLDTVFSGTKVLIGSNTYNVNNEINFASFKYSDKQIVYGPCEISAH